jgi:hypothetical protein
LKKWGRRRAGDGVTGSETTKTLEEGRFAEQLQQRSLRGHVVFIASAGAAGSMARRDGWKLTCWVEIRAQAAIALE